mmetsp:Transcript_66454/g.152285  ORF Transcript_66454/g.152285 Transcript_66454/m.152285 type:complete len:227 (+) Transcript_66454:749-1429(+)
MVPIHPQLRHLALQEQLHPNLVLDVLRQFGSVVGALAEHGHLGLVGVVLVQSDRIRPLLMLLHALLTFHNDRRAALLRLLLRVVHLFGEPFFEVVHLVVDVDLRFHHGLHAFALHVMQPLHLLAALLDRDCSHFFVVRRASPRLAALLSIETKRLRDVRRPRRRSIRLELWWHAVLHARLRMRRIRDKHRPRLAVALALSEEFRDQTLPGPLFEVPPHVAQLQRIR